MGVTVEVEAALRPARDAVRSPDRLTWWRPLGVETGTEQLHGGRPTSGVERERDTVHSGPAIVPGDLERVVVPVLQPAREALSELQPQPRPFV
jgi:hypothetical protein